MWPRDNDPPSLTTRDSGNYLAKVGMGPLPSTALEHTISC